MLVKIIDLNDESVMNEFLIKMNTAFKERVSKKILYTEITLNDLRKKTFKYALCIYKNSDMVAGVCIFKDERYESNAVLIKHLWVSSAHKRQGIADYLLKKIEGLETLDDTNIISLSVANIYLPAVRLYKKNGYKSIKIHANIPNTFYLIEMMKTLGMYRFPLIKRYYSLIKTWLKFIVLYRKDSSPTILNRKIYEKRK